jgi:hypothetical protein
VAAIKMTGMALKVLEMVVPLAGASSELGKATMDSLRKLGSFVPPGAVTPADMQNIIQQLMTRQQQFGQNMAAMRKPGAEQQSAQQQQPAAAQQMQQAA